jgi:hypothetical protein
MGERLDLWLWAARDTAAKARPVRVQAATYLDALIAAAKHYGKRDHRGDPDLAAVQVRVLREYELGKVA